MNLRNVLLLTGAFAALAIVVEVVIVKADGKNISAGKVGIEETESLFPVTVDVVSVRDMRSYIELNGVIEADNTIDVYPEIGGRYALQRFRVGDRVKAGDRIAEVDPSKPGNPYAMSAIRAPITGTITALPRKVGSTVTTETIVAKVGDIDHLQVRLQIPEREIANLRIGLPAVVAVEAYPGESFPASIGRISPLVDAVTHTKEVFLSFARNDSRINAGMFARIKLYTKLYRDAVVVPDDAIVTNFEKTFVYVVGPNDTVAMREIGKGVSIDGWSIVPKGLSAGEKIVVGGANVLSDGAKVRTVGEQSAAGKSRESIHE